MSHFAVIVIGNDIDKQLEPYDESIEVERYSKGVVSEYDKKRMMEFYKGEGSFDNFDECYSLFGDDWNRCRYEKNNEGQWEDFSTYNPYSKWDWYVIGGRWSGLLKLKDGTKPLESLTFHFSTSEERKEAMLKDNRANVAYKRDIANLSEIIPFAIVKDGKWYERGECGWFGSVFDDKGEKQWSEEVRELIESIDDNEIVSIVDCHI